ncbi:Methionine ABC transporter ATP-binding protein [Caenispirillum salinarum AK4]|uniref:Methionine ABC transporter ATP-binding protein n=1 Tax=Caenispirillum salinarum AK4 TaxID=1238182 RepID=K9GTZ9_9PROT|nr:ATP-binding cassette domain-containing protein [Caenispirillum salinarum]EKV28622.1 Methionine ABC transporter ATP-binding protein [Caenispirillum salinarum AK4]
MDPMPHASPEETPPRPPDPAARDAHGGEVVIRVRDLVTHYGDRQILKNVSLDVHAGEILVIMGGSGSGKSTLLNHLLGLLRPTSGVIEVLGKDINTSKESELTEIRRKFGVAFQGGALFSSMNLLENIMLPLYEHTDLDRRTMEIMARMKMEVVSLSGFDDLMPAELSGGMIKRAALARAIVMDPRILFCDEPSAGLDPVVAANIDDLILDLRDATGMSVVVVTHELESAFKIADRICVLDKGKVLTIAPVDEVRANPDQRIQNLLNRRTEEEELDPEAYLRRLTGEKEP